jgi:hypothetical protein
MSSTDSVDIIISYLEIFDEKSAWLNWYIYLKIWSMDHGNMLKKMLQMH